MQKIIIIIKIIYVKHLSILKGRKSGGQPMVWYRGSSVAKKYIKNVLQYFLKFQINRKYLHGTF